MSLQISGWAFVFDLVFELRVCVWREGKLKKTEREQSTQQQKMNVYVLYLCVWERENEVVSSLLQLIQIREFAYGCLNYNSWWLIYTHTHTHTHTHSLPLALCAATASKMIKSSLVLWKTVSSICCIKITSLRIFTLTKAFYGEQRALCNYRSWLQFICGHMSILRLFLPRMPSSLGAFFPFWTQKEQKPDFVKKNCMSHSCSDVVQLQEEQFMPLSRFGFIIRQLAVKQ